MTKWISVSTTFSEEELAIIDEVAKRTNISRSELVRRCVVGIVTATRLMTVLGNQRLAVTKAANTMVKKMFDEKTVKELEKEASKIKASIKPQTYRNNEKRYKKIHEEGRVFREHRPRGRPKSKTRKRGRPKDLGVKG